jgi:hypothetical protein
LQLGLLAYYSMANSEIGTEEITIVINGKEQKQVYTFTKNRTKPSVFVQLYAVFNVFTQPHKTIQLVGYNWHFRATWFYGVYGFFIKMMLLLLLY